MTAERPHASPAARGSRASLWAALLAGVGVLTVGCGDSAVATSPPTRAGGEHAATPDVALPVESAAQPVEPAERVDASDPDLTDASARDAALLALLASCRDRERRLVSELDWVTAREAPGTLALRLTEPRSIETLTVGELRLDALLLVSAPDATQPRLLARLGKTLYSAFTRPDPALYAELAATLEGDDAAR